MGDHHLEELSEQYLTEKNIAPVTLKTYRIVFKHYIMYLKEHNIKYAKTSDVIHYRESKRRIGYSSHWIYIQMSALKGLYRYLRVNQKHLDLPEEYAYDIMVPVNNERIKHQIKKPILTISQAKHLILHTKNNRQYIWHYRDHAIIYLMLTSGLRSIEIVRAKKTDYQVVDGKTVLYVERKGKRSNE
jgi:integrase/recombinase XerD